MERRRPFFEDRLYCYWCSRACCVVLQFWRIDLKNLNVDKQLFFFRYAFFFKCKYAFGSCSKIWSMEEVWVIRAIGYKGVKKRYSEATSVVLVRIVEIKPISP